MLLEDPIGNLNMFIVIFEVTFFEPLQGPNAFKKVAQKKNNINIYINSTLFLDVAHFI